MNDSGIYLSVIIPAYNEEDRIQKTLEAVASYLDGQPYSYEVIVVSDGSTDNTAQVVKHMIRSQPYLRFIDREENRGKGFTVKEVIDNIVNEAKIIWGRLSSVHISE